MSIPARDKVQSRRRKLLYLPMRAGWARPNAGRKPVKRNASASGFIHRKMSESCIRDEAASTVRGSGALFAPHFRKSQNNQNSKNNRTSWPHLIRTSSNSPPTREIRPIGARRTISRRNKVYWAQYSLITTLFTGFLTSFRQSIFTSQFIRKSTKPRQV